MTGNWGNVLVSLKIALAAIVVLLLPGYAGLRVLSRLSRRELDAGTVLGLSLALHPVVALWMTVAKVRLSAAMLWTLYLGCGLLALAWGWWNRYKERRVRYQLMCSTKCGGDPYSAGVSRLRLGLLSRFVPRTRPGDIGWLIGLFGLVLVVRFVQIRDLVVPAWVDSLHHTLIVRLITEQGQIPSSFEPYLPVSFFYYFGFHTLAAAFGQLAGLGPPRAILIIGQILNAGVILTVYRLAYTLTRRRMVGLVAAAFTGLASQMPAYYVSWGRYTLLTGMALLPVTMAVAVETWQEPEKPGQGVLLAVLTGGLILTHYIATVFYSIFLAILVLLGSGQEQSQKWSRQGQRAIWLLIWSALGVGLVSPWLWHILEYMRPYLRLEVWPIRTVNEAYFPNYVGYLWSLMRHARTWVLLFLALPGVVCAIVRHCPVKVLFVWILAILLFFNSWWWRLGPVRLDLVLICLFVPVCVLAGYGLVVIQKWARRKLRLYVFKYTVIIITALLCIWGISETLSIVNPVTVLAGKADVKAIAWIKDHTPPSARFLINVEPWYRMYRGADGGWWIPLLSDRDTILPPVVYAWGDRDYVYKVIEVAERVRALQGCDVSLWQLMEQQDITHIYIGVNGGVLQQSWFENCPGIWLIYNQDGVRIYEVRQTGKVG